MDFFYPEKKTILMHIFQMTFALAVVLLSIVIFKTYSARRLLLGCRLEIYDGLVALEEDRLSNHDVIKLYLSTFLRIYDCLLKFYCSKSFPAVIKNTILSFYENFSNTVTYSRFSLVGIALVHLRPLVFTTNRHCLNGAEGSSKICRTQNA